MRNGQRKKFYSLSWSLVAIPFSLLLVLSPSVAALAQTQTTGRIVGTVKDKNGAVIAGAEVTIISGATGDERKVTTDAAGNYTVPILPPGTYRVSITAGGFAQTLVENVEVSITETRTVDAGLEAGVVKESVTIQSAALVQSSGPQLGRVVDPRAVLALPLATRNFTQILGLSPGTAIDLPDNTAVGRNSQNISVNGARMVANNYQINGVDANVITTNTTPAMAVPAPETIQEFKVQTSLYDATFGRSAGGNVQIVTKSGANDTHGAAYEYFRNDALNANNPFLKAAGVKRPVLKRNVFGGTLGGSIQKNKSFYFTSYQGTRERNGASPNSLSSNILIAPGLTDDRSEQTLLDTFRPVLPPPNGRPATFIDPVALALLNVKLGSGQFLIPTPQADGHYSGSAPSDFREDQFNTNIDYRVNERNWLAVKFFFSDAPSAFAMFGGPNVPGFGADQKLNNRIVAIQDIHSFSARVINEARIGYNFIRNDFFPQEPVKDSDLGIHRANADAFPGLGLISIAPNAGGVVIGTATTVTDFQLTAPSTTATDILSIAKGDHFIRLGATVIYYQNDFTANQLSRGSIDFLTFNNFLTGSVNNSGFGSGINTRSLRSIDYSFFVQDDWKLSSKVTLNLGLRYELDLPPYDTRGRLSTFDPSFYKRRLLVINGDPQGPPVGGFVQAGNVIPGYDLPDVPKVGKRVLRSLDPNNFAPRIGFTYSPLASDRLVLRGGYGIFYSRASNSYLFSTTQSPPGYVIGRKPNPPFDNPFFALPTSAEFPTFVPRIALANPVFDRNLRTPYLHQYNTSLQYAVGTDLLLEVAYVGTRGLNLFRVVAINQAPLASPQHPIINQVTGVVITTNNPANAALRAPFQGVTINSFGQNQTTAQSSYNSLQVSLTKRFSKGLQFLGSYTYAKSIDNTLGGSTAVGAVNETSFFPGNQLDNRSNRGVSNFDRRHRFVLSYLWDLPDLSFAAKSTAGRLMLSNWHVAGIFIAMSGLPIDIVDSGAGSLYGLSNGPSPLARPNWAPGATRASATSNVPDAYYFNPFAFVRPVVQGGQPITSSHGAALADSTGTDIGDVGRNVLRGPSQTNADFSLIKRFRLYESKNIEFRAEFFNLFNHVNLANPISNFNAVPKESIDQNTGRIIGDPGEFGRINATSNNPRLIQLALKLNF